MKINRHNTALHFLDSSLSKTKYTLHIPKNWSAVQLESIRYMMEVGFQNKRELYKKKIQYISDPFLEAYSAAYHKLGINLIEDTDHFEKSGVMILRRPDGERSTYFYTASITRDSTGTTELKGSLIVFGTEKGNPSGLPVLQCVHVKDPMGNPFNYMGGTEVGIGPAGRNEKDTRAFAVWIDLVFLLIFMRYCDVETKIVTPGRKADHAGHKYINDTTQLIEVVDSTWFTTIVRSDGFGVTGHLRLQPYPSLKTKKWIYIHAYEKKGYTRKAKILTQNPDL